MWDQAGLYGNVVKHNGGLEGNLVSCETRAAPLPPKGVDLNTLYLTTTKKILNTTRAGNT
jgi:hypothetical protein